MKVATATLKVLNICFNSVDIISKIFKNRNLNTKDKELYDKTLNDLSEFVADELLESRHSNKKGLFFIKIYPDADFEKRGVKMKTIFNELYNMGHLKTISRDRKEDDITKSNKYPIFWELFLSTDREIEDIEEALFFVEDESNIYFLTEKNLLDDSEFIAFIQENALNNPEIKLNDIHNIVDKIINKPLVKQKNVPSENKYSTKIQKHETATLRIDAIKLDELMRYVSELISIKTEIRLSAKLYGYNKILEVSEKLDNITLNIRENVFDLRLVSLETIKTKFERLVRDTASKLNKKVSFSASGLNTELDKAIVDSISAPLLHIIRNCVDHGIESPEKRVESGKSEQGNIRFDAYQLSSKVYIKISDDGAGINKQRIIQKARAKNLIDSSEELTEKDVYNLIFKPGLSTAQVISEISGRGVGMDVVKSEISKLRGEIEIESVEGKGTTVVFILPLSVSILDTMLIRTGAMHFSIPLEEIEECIIVKQNELDLSENKFIKYNSKLIPYISLSEIFNIKNNHKKNKRAIIIKDKKKYTAVITDKVIDEFQAVVKPLGESFKNRDYLSGGILLPDGNVAYVLNTGKLIYHYSNIEKLN
ncbi:MAG: chemotaxis protein CheA [bacterium]|nr:chemotaxis protein CheA [bacterium]